MNPPTFADAVQAWYAVAARDLPWRRPDTTAWEVLVSEVMLQQTQVSRVEPVWRAWVTRWPTPAALAAESAGEAVRAWGRLGYPRRALRLHATAVAITADHNGVVPGSATVLRTLPGIGDYTAAAVAAFAYDEPTAVLDTNVRRVYARVFDAGADAPAAVTRREREAATGRLPQDAPARYSVAVMELGALVCTARAPRCEACPVSPRCAWRAAGFPETGATRRRQPAYSGSDREVRGRVLERLRADPTSDLRAVAADCADRTQFDRALTGLLADGLVEPLPDGHFRLPA